jgi:hypothetical protein
LQMIDSVVEEEAAEENTTEQEWSFHEIFLGAGCPVCDSRGSMGVARFLMAEANPAGGVKGLALD